MGVFMVVRAGVALVGRIPEMLVSYRRAPTMGPLSYLVQMTDAGSVPCSTFKGQMAETVDFGPKEGTSVQATERNRTVLHPAPS